MTKINEQKGSFFEGFGGFFHPLRGTQNQASRRSKGVLSFLCSPIYICGYFDLNID